MTAPVKSVNHVLAPREPCRIKLSHNATNIGEANTRNRAFAASVGNYIAIMDADDWCDPTRLAKQVAFLQTHADVDLVTTWAQRIRQDGMSLLPK